MQLGILAALAGFLLAACGPGGEARDAYGHLAQNLAESGPWHIPGDVSSIGDTQSVHYTSAGPWVGSSGCAPWLLSGTVEFRDWLYQAFPQNNGIGGYNCRAINGNSSMMSVHATGRALDIYIQKDGTEADNGQGDPVGNWLIMHAQEIGIQYIIWDLWTWRADRSPGSKDRAYGGSHPHDNHLHVELSVDGANGRTPWFQGARSLPGTGSTACTALPPEGGTISEIGPCTQRFGPSKYWRYVDTSGEGGQLYWTNAFKSTDPSNWARQTISLQEAGRYRLEAYVDPAYGVYDSTRYTLRHAGTDETFLVDQGVASGWTLLGEFEFDAGGDEQLSLFDNVQTSVPSDQHIVLDSLRLTRIQPPPPADPPPSDPPPADPPPSDPPPTNQPPADPGPTTPPVTEPGPGDPAPADPAPSATPPNTLTGSGGCSSASGEGALTGLELMVLFGLLGPGTGRRRRITPKGQ